MARAVRKALAADRLELTSLAPAPSSATNDVPETLQGIEVESASASDFDLLTGESP